MRRPRSPSCCSSAPACWRAAFDRLLSVDLGFSAAIRSDLRRRRCRRRKYGQPTQRQEFIETLLERTATNPNVESAGAIFGLPLSNARFGISTSTRDGVTLSDDEQDHLTLQVRIVTPDYFKTMAIPVVKGRGFAAGDRFGSELVAMMNATGAALVWPDQDAMGHQLEIGTRFGQGGARAGGRVVGIVGGCSRLRSGGPVPPTLYLPHGQWPVGRGDDRGEGAQRRSICARPADARAAAGPRSRRADVRGAIDGSDCRRAAVAQPRLYLVLIASFAGTAMLLAAIGLYGVLAYAVGQRTREIGIRLALGAKRGEVLRMVMRQAGTLAIAGVAIGLVAAGVASRALRAQLFQIAPTDTVTYVMVGTGLLLVALLASWIPARRASRIDPLTALRHD